LLIAVLCSGVFLGAIDAHLVNVALPDMLRAFPGSSLTGLSWVMTGYTTAFTAALLPSGGLADRFGHRRVYLAGLAVFVVGGTLCAVAPTPGALIAARAVQGLGGGTLTPLALALILPQYPVARRGAAIGLWSATQSAAVAAGPSLGGVLVSAWGWRTIFLLHLPLGLVAFAGTWRALPPDAEPAAPERVPDLAGVGLLLAAIALPALAIAQLREWGPASGRTVLVLAGGTCCAVLFAWRALRHPAPAVDLRILRVGGAARANTAMLLFGFVLFTWTVTNVLFLTGVWGFSETRAGLALTPGPIVQALLAPVAGRLTSRLGHRAPAIMGAVLLFGAELMLATGTGHHAAYRPVVLPALLLASAGFAALITSLSAAAVAGMPADRLATGTALSVTARAYGAVVGVSGVALVLSGGPRGGTAGYHAVWSSMAVVCVLLAVVVARLGARPAARAGA
jgi:EmrB/QacA subfamily drug resistance transporter